MYVGRKHTSTARLEKVLPFRCVRCSHEAQALVIGIGQGQGNSPYFLDESGAKQRAAAESESAAEQNAKLTLKLAACPKCGARDDATLRAMKAKTIAAMLGCLIAMPLLGLFVDALNRTSSGVWIIGPCGVLSAWIVWKMQSWRWTTVDNRVAFVSGK